MHRSEAGATSKESGPLDGCEDMSSGGPGYCIGCATVLEDSILDLSI